MPKDIRSAVLYHKFIAKGLTLDELSKLSGVDRSTIHKIITGRVRNPRKENLNKLIKALGISPSDFENYSSTNHQDRNTLREKYRSSSCYLCGKKFNEDDFTLQHVLPIAYGGSDTEDNLIPVCSKDNARFSHSLSPTSITDKLLERYSAKELAVKIGIDPSNLSRFRNGKSHLRTESVKNLYLEYYEIFHNRIISTKDARVTDKLFTDYLAKLLPKYKLSPCPTVSLYSTSLACDFIAVDKSDNTHIVIECSKVKRTHNNNQAVTSNIQQLISYMSVSGQPYGLLLTWQSTASADEHLFLEQWVSNTNGRVLEIREPVFIQTYNS